MEKIEQLITLLTSVPNEKIILFIIMGLILVLWKIIGLIKETK